MSVLENDLDPNVFIGVSLPLGLSDDGFFKKTRKIGFHELIHLTYCWIVWLTILYYFVCGILNT